MFEPNGKINTINEKRRIADQLKDVRGNLEKGDVQQIKDAAGVSYRTFYNACGADVARVSLFSMQRIYQAALKVLNAKYSVTN